MMQDPLSSIDRFEIERACERLVYTYVRALDRGDMSAAADCFAVDGSFARPMTPATVVHGREAIRAGLKSRPPSLLTKHVASNVLIEVDSRDSAHGISYLTMIATTPQAGAEPPHVSSVRSISESSATASCAKRVSGAFSNAAVPFN